MTRREGRRKAVIIGGSMGGLFIGNMLVRRGWLVGRTSYCCFLYMRHSLP